MDRMVLRRSGRTRGSVAVEQLSVIGLIAVVGAVGLAKLGTAAQHSIAGDAGARAARAPMAMSSMAGVGEAAAKLERVLSTAERAGLEASPIGAHLALSADPAWAQATEYVMGKRLSTRRALGQPIRYAFEAFLDEGRSASATAHEQHVSAPLKHTLGLLDRRPRTVIGPYLDGERFTKFVDDKLFDLFANDAHIRVGSTDAGGAPFAFAGRELVLHGNHRLIQGVATNTDAILDQILERYALHLLEHNGAPPEAAYALHDWLVASEALRDAAGRRVNLETTLGKMEKEYAEAVATLRYNKDLAEARAEPGAPPPESYGPKGLASVFQSTNDAEDYAQTVRVLEDQMPSVREALAETEAEVAALHATERAAARRFELGDFKGNDDASLQGVLERMDRLADEADAFLVSIGRDRTPTVARAAKTKVPTTAGDDAAGARAELLARTQAFLDETR